MEICPAGQGSDSIWFSQGILLGFSILIPSWGIVHLQSFPLPLGKKKNPFFCWLLTQETGGQPHFSSLNQSCSASPYAGLPPA